jgi:hypothetical protein
MVGDRAKTGILMTTGPIPERAFRGLLHLEALSQACRKERLAIPGKRFLSREGAGCEKRRNEMAAKVLKTNNPAECPIHCS